MKYPLLSAMPSWGVTGWLDEQLEARGIDPVVYTRYVLGLLRRDAHSDKGPSKRVRREDCESVRRAAAVQCLMSASDQVGMETLVDELCIKLQDISSLAGSPPHQPLGDWPPLAAAPRPMGAVLDQAPPTGWCDDDDARSGWPRRLYQRQADAEAEGDPSLARLMAKFDQSIEALWSPGPEAELPADEPTACDFALPISSPGSKSHVFIPNGTNITSSIWSDCGDEDATLARNGDLDGGAWPEPEGPGWSGELGTGTGDCPGVWAEPEGPGWAGDAAEGPGLDAWAGDEAVGRREGDRSGAWAEPDDPGATWAPSWAAALLNHSKQESSFTEVVPKPHEEPLPLDAARLPDVRPSEATTEATEPSDGDQESQEDLLTSTRTHFKPIRSEAADAEAAEAGGGAGAAGYADGTTFVIAAGLEVLAFRRCQSGTLLLDSDQLDSPAKYREYKEKEPYAGRYCRDADLGDDVSEFVPKFRVSVNEKCCQTDPALAPPPPLAETEADEYGTLPMDTDAELFFPGDSDAWSDCAGTALAEERRHGTWDDCAGTALVEERRHGTWDGCAGTALAEERRMPRHNAWDDLDCGCRAPEGLATWEQAGGWAQAGLADTIWQAPCGLCWDAGRAEGGGGAAAPRLREELSRDGDQLLSDLSYVFLGSDWLQEVDAPGNATDAAACWEQQDDDYGGAPWGGKLQCLSPADADGDADADRAALRHHARSVDAFLSTCLLSALPSALVLSASASAAAQRTPARGHSERKRRHSVCQRSVPEPPGYVRRPPCALVSHSLRPVTL